MRAIHVVYGVLTVASPAPACLVFGSEVGEFSDQGGTVIGEIGEGGDSAAGARENGGLEAGSGAGIGGDSWLFRGVVRLEARGAMTWDVKPTGAGAPERLLTASYAWREAPFTLSASADSLLMPTPGAAVLAIGAAGVLVRRRSGRA